MIASIIILVFLIAVLIISFIQLSFLQFLIVFALIYGLLHLVAELRYRRYSKLLWVSKHVIALRSLNYSIFGIVVDALKGLWFSIWSFIKGIIIGLKLFFIKFALRFVKSSIIVKISHFVMGFTQLVYKQYVRAIIFFLFEYFYFYIMITNPTINNTPIGFKAIGNFITLGSFPGSEVLNADNSFLMLLFGLVTILLTVFFIAIYFYSVNDAINSEKLAEEGHKLPTFKEDLRSLTGKNFHKLMLTPALVGIIIFTILPTILMISIAFTNYDSAHSSSQSLFDWAGLSAFFQIFNSGSEIGARFFPVLSWTLIWAVIATFSCYLLGILLALLINKKGIKFKKVYRTIFILTIAIPQFVSLLVMRQLLDVSGPVNALFHTSIDFLGAGTSNAISFWEIWLPRITILVINLWIGIPYTMLQTTGVLMNVPKDLYEAAEMDGANKTQIFWKITLPYILFITTPALITSFMGNITSFNIIYLLTGGGPAVGTSKAGATDLLVTWLYKLTVDNADYNIGAVISILTFIIMAIGTLISYRRSKAYKDEEAFQ